MTEEVTTTFLLNGEDTLLTEVTLLTEEVTLLNSEDTLT